MEPTTHSYSPNHRCECIFERRPETQLLHEARSRMCSCSTLDFATTTEESCLTAAYMCLLTVKWKYRHYATLPYRLLRTQNRRKIKKKTQTKISSLRTFGMRYCEPRTKSKLSILFSYKYSVYFSLHGT